MANFKRKSTKRRVRCTICTAYRWLGNSKRRWKAKDKSKMLDLTYDKLSYL